MNKSNELSLLLEILDQAYEKKAWHGTNLRGSIRGLTAREAAWRPARGRHNIWEIVLHAAYWKYTMRRRLQEEKRGSFPLKGSNWFTRPAEVTEKAWRSDIALLDETHRSMRRAIETLNGNELRTKAPGGTYTHATLIYGIASHDLYHAGQIQVIKRLMRK